MTGLIRQVLQVTGLSRQVPQVTSLDRLPNCVLGYNTELCSSILHPCTYVCTHVRCCPEIIQSVSAGKTHRSVHAHTCTVALFKLLAHSACIAACPCTAAQPSTCRGRPGVSNTGCQLQCSWEGALSASVGSCSRLSA